jgi:hypothetical protein
MILLQQLDMEDLTPSPVKHPTPPPSPSAREVGNTSSSPCSSRTLSLEPHADHLEPVTNTNIDNEHQSQKASPEPSIHDPTPLAQYTQYVLNATHCSFDLSLSSDSDSDLLSSATSTLPKKRRVTHRKEHSPPPTKHKEEIHYGNLPLIDRWVAQAKGLTQEEVQDLDGFGDWDGRGEVPVVQATCAMWGEEGGVISDEHLTRYEAMGLVDRDDEDL